MKKQYHTLVLLLALSVSKVEGRLSLRRRGHVRGKRNYQLRRLEYSDDLEGKQVNHEKFKGVSKGRDSGGSGMKKGKMKGYSDDSPKGNNKSGGKSDNGDGNYLSTDEFDSPNLDHQLTTFTIIDPGEYSGSTAKARDDSGDDSVSANKASAAKKANNQNYAGAKKGTNGNKKGGNKMHGGMMAKGNKYGSESQKEGGSDWSSDSYMKKKRAKSSRSNQKNSKLTHKGASNDGASSSYDESPPAHDSGDGPVACPADVFECPDGTFVGRTEPDCLFELCPELDDDAPQKDEDDDYFIVTDTEPPVACTLEVQICPDGSSVGRTGPNCEFEPCPEPVPCDDDVFECPDGTFVGREGPDCEFAVCPDTVACTEDVFECPDGSFVGREGPDCEFALCPEQDLETAAPTAEEDGPATEAPEDPVGVPEIPSTSAPTPAPDDESEDPVATEAPEETPITEAPEVDVEATEAPDVPEVALTSAPTEAPVDNVPNATSAPTGAGSTTRPPVAEGATDAPTVMTSAPNTKNLVYFTIEYGFAEGTAREPTEEEIKEVICKTNIFFRDVIRNHTKDDTMNSEATNIDWSFVSTDRLPARLSFTANVTSNGYQDPVPLQTVFDAMQLTTEEIEDYILFYVWAVPSQDNVFRETSAANFTNKANIPFPVGKLASYECPDEQTVEQKNQACVDCLAVSADCEAACFPAIEADPGSTSSFCFNCLVQAAQNCEDTCAPMLDAEAEGGAESQCVTCLLDPAANCEELCQGAFADGVDGEAGLTAAPVGDDEGETTEAPIEDGGEPTEAPEIDEVGDGAGGELTEAPGDDSLGVGLPATSAPTGEVAVPTDPPEDIVTETAAPTAAEGGVALENDGCVDAVELEAGDTLQGTTVLANEDDDFEDCGVGLELSLFPEVEDGFSIEQRGVWYSIEATDTRLRASVCSDDVQTTFAVTIYAGGDDCTGLICSPVYNTAGCAVEWEAASDFEMYYILVQSLSVAGTESENDLDFELSITEPSSPTNDLCEEAIELELGDTIAASVLSASEKEDSEGACVLQLQPPSPNVLIPGIWFSVSGNGGSITASTCRDGVQETPEMPTLVTIYSGTCDNLECETNYITEDPCSAQLASTEAGKKYYIFVEKLLRGDDEGQFELAVDGGQIEG